VLTLRDNVAVRPALDVLVPYKSSIVAVNGDSGARRVVVRVIPSLGRPERVSAGRVSSPVARGFFLLRPLASTFCALVWCASAGSLCGLGRRLTAALS
jgi:hypothetical protein